MCKALCIKLYANVIQVAAITYALLTLAILDDVKSFLKARGEK